METKKKILIVTYFYPPIGGIGLPGAQRVVKFIKYFRNYDITVLTVKEEDYNGADLNFKRKLPIKDEEICRAPGKNLFTWVLAVRRVKDRVLGSASRGPSPGSPPVAVASLPPAPGSYKGALLQSLKDLVYELCNFPDYASGWILPAFRRGYRMARVKKFDLIFATGMPWSALVLAWLLHKVSGAKLVVDFRDPWVGNPFHCEKGWFLDRLEKLLERLVVRDASLVSANTAVLKDEMSRRYQGVTDTGKFIMLPNGFDPEDFRFFSDDAAAHSDHGAAPLVMAHAGYFYGMRDPSPFLDAVRLLDRSGAVPASAFRFLQMGGVKLGYDIEGKYSDLIEQGVFIDLGSLPYDECLKELSRADCLLLLQQGTRSQVPSKLYDYLCLKRHIIAITPFDGELGSMILENGFGDLFAPDDVAGLALRLQELLAEKTSKGAITSDYAERYKFDVRNITRELEQRMDSLLCGEGSRCP